MTTWIQKTAVFQVVNWMLNSQLILMARPYIELYAYGVILRKTNFSSDLVAKSLTK